MQKWGVESWNRALLLRLGGRQAKWSAHQTHEYSYRFQSHPHDTSLKQVFFNSSPNFQSSVLSLVLLQVDLSEVRKSEWSKLQYRMRSCSDQASNKVCWLTWLVNWCYVCYWKSVSQPVMLSAMKTGNVIGGLIIWVETFSFVKYLTQQICTSIIDKDLHNFFFPQNYCLFCPIRNS